MPSERAPVLNLDDYLDIDHLLSDEEPAIRDTVRAFVGRNPP